MVDKVLVNAIKTQINLASLYNGEYSGSASCGLALYNWTDLACPIACWVIEKSLVQEVVV